MVSDPEAAKHVLRATDNPKRPIYVKGLVAEVRPGCTLKPVTLLTRTMLLQRLLQTYNFTTEKRIAARCSVVQQQSWRVIKHSI